MKILVIQTGFIGDNILSTPVYTELVENFKKAKIDLLTTKLSSQLFQSDPRFNQVLVYDKRGNDSGLSGFLRILKLIKNNNYSKIISLHKSIRTSLLSFFSKVGFSKTSRTSKTYGYKESALSFLYSKTSSRGKEEHEVLRILNILKSLNIKSDIKTKKLPLKLFFSDSESNKINNILDRSFSSKNLKSKKPLVGIAPGSVWATKRWTVDGFKQLVSLLESSNLNVVLIGGPKDIEKCNEIKTEKSISLAGELSLSESTCLVSKLDCIVTNDSSPLHIAASVNTPTVAIFCATVPEFGYTPWMVKNRIVEVKNLECRPCGRHGGKICPTGTNFCQNKISSKEVYDACLEILSGCKEMPNEDA